MPLVINSLGGGHTHTHICMYIYTDFSGMHQPLAAGLKLLFYGEFY